jgi:16S rRNA G966 N2-methylase RsmD
MKHVLSIAAIVALSRGSAHAVSCEQGMKVIGQMSKVLELNEVEQNNIQALIDKAKREEEQGHEHDCKVILADAIRFFLIKTVLE